MLADLLLVGAVLSWGAYLTLSKPLILRHGALPVLAGTFLVGCLLQLPIALVTLPGWLPMLGHASTRAWTSLAILALLITPLNLALQNLSLRRLDASQVATFSNVAPVLTVAWGVLFFSEALPPALIVGGLLTLGGIVWTSRPRPPARGGSRHALILAGLVRRDANPLCSASRPGCSRVVPPVSGSSDP